jgi:neutral ceramidase
MANLLVGVGKTCITPPPDMFPFPMWLGYHITGVHSDLFCRSLVIDNGDNRVLIMSFDLVGVPDEKETIRLLSKETGISPESIFLSATHTHACPFVSEESEFMHFVRKRCLTSAKQALDNLRPAKFGYGTGKSYVNVNRDFQQEDGYWIQAPNYEGFSDKTLAVLKFEDLDCNLICAILNYAVIPATTYLAEDEDGRQKICSDIPGVATEYIERRFGNGAVAIWTCGAAGNQGTHIVCMRAFDDKGYATLTFLPPGTAYRWATIHGQLHAIDAIKVINKIVCSDGPFQIVSKGSAVHLPAQKPPEGADMHYNRLLLENMVPLADDGSYPEKKLIEMEDDPDNPVELKLRLLLLGDVALFGIGGMPYNELGVLCKDKSPFENTVVVTNVCRSAGYIINNTNAHKRPFTYFGRIKPGHCDEIVINGMLKLFEMCGIKENQ